MRIECKFGGEQCRPAKRGSLERKCSLFRSMHTEPSKGGFKRSGKPAGPFWPEDLWKKMVQKIEIMAKDPESGCALADQVIERFWKIEKEKRERGEIL